MKNLILSLSFVICPLAFGQAASALTDSAKKSSEILLKVEKIDVLNQLLPVLMTKEQIRAILPAIEKARKAVVDQEKIEAEMLRKLEPKLDVAIKEAEENGKVPTRETLRETQALFLTFSIKRKQIGDDNADNVIKVVSATLNKGQIKAMQGALNPKYLYPDLDPATMTAENKLRFFVKELLLNRQTYPILLKLAK